jgi:hypothetical protein
MGKSIGNGQGILSQSRLRGRDASSAFGDTTQLDHSFGERINVGFDRFGDFIEQLVETNEARPLHVPVGLLHLRFQIDRTGKSQIQQVNQFATAALGDVIFGFV